MGITTRIDAKADLRVHTVAGELRFEELLAQLEGFYSGPEFRPGQSALWDLREAILTGFTVTEVRGVAELVRKYWGEVGAPPRAALVVARDVDFGMARMLELQLAHDSANEVRVFRDFEDAMAWVKGAGTGVSG